MCMYTPSFTYRYITNHQKSLIENDPTRKYSLSKLKNGNKNITTVITKSFNVKKKKKRKTQEKNPANSV